MTPSKTGSTQSELARDVTSLRAGDHLCLVYDDDPAEQMEALLPFIRQGLVQNERCIYVADDNAAEAVRAALRGYGVDVEREESRGALILWTRREWRPGGELISDVKAAEVRRVIADALAAGFSGIRFGIEMTWTLGPDISAERLRHWEATLNTVLTPDKPARMICQYSRRRLATGVIGAAMSTHPIAVLGTDVCANPFYDAPTLLSGSVPPAPLPSSPEQIDWMLSRLQWARAYEREREERRRVEAALQEAEGTLERVLGLFKTAQTAHEMVREEMKVKDEFIGLLSHELRTPITTILGNAQVLRRRNGQLSKSDHELALNDIELEAERLHQLIENLLVLARIENGQQIEKEPHLVERILEPLVAEHRKRFPHRAVDVSIGSMPEPVSLHCAYFEQALRNVLGNAEKYSPRSEPIEVIVERRAGELLVTIADRGPGIAPEQAARVFAAFYRARETAAAVDGVGIGLAVCRRLLDVQGGAAPSRVRRCPDRRVARPSSPSSLDEPSDQAVEGATSAALARPLVAVARSRRTTSTPPPAIAHPAPSPAATMKSMPLIART